MVEKVFGRLSSKAFTTGLSPFVRICGLCCFIHLSFGDALVLGQQPEFQNSFETKSRRTEQLTATSVSDSERVRTSLERQYRELWDGMSDDAHAGYRALVDNVYLPYDFDDEVLAGLDSVEHSWKLTDAPLAPGERLSTWRAYGLAPRPDDPALPLQYVVKDDPSQKTRQYAMNCFACHGGSLYGATYPGAPNTTYSLESLTDQVRKIKIAKGKPLAHMDVGSVFMPLGKTVGTSNAVMFGVALMNFRDNELNVHMERPPAEMTHHDMDAPPWWHFHRKSHIYIDGFAEKGHRGLMQFMLVRQNGPDKFKSWEHDFENVYAFISSLRPPKYPLDIDSDLAARGKSVFQSQCAQCHGTYGEKSEYPELMVDIEDIGTDRVRFDSLTTAHRSHYGASWFGHFGKQETIESPRGYTAPPLDGIWASAPYFHNGSVPTLWDVLNPDDRPLVWSRNQLGIDTKNVGLAVERLASVPKSLSLAERRWYFDTRQFGKSASGHDYPSQLTKEERIAVLEYLKTL